jgi:heme oxygenase
MGDLYGGQMIKKIVPGSHKALEFKEPRTTIEKIRLKLEEDMAYEANRAFDWAIRMMRDYDKDLGEGN